jgi:hypothetical protein
MVGEKRIDNAARLASIRARVFVFVRSSRSRLHGHDHEDTVIAPRLFEQPATREETSQLIWMGLVGIVQG